jgi:hypothetical protein
MTKTIRIFRTVVAHVTSLALAVAPLSLMPANRAYAQQPTAEEDDTLAGRAASLEVRLLELTDRATYPQIPRLGVRGLPTQTEVQDAGRKLQGLAKAILALPSTIPAITDEREEALPFFEIQGFYDCATKFEGLKILLGQEVNPEEWDQKYRLDFPLSDLSQLRFTQIASFLSESFVQIPGIADEVLLRRSEGAAAVRTRLDLRHRTITMTLSPSFLDTYENLRYLNQMNTKSALMFAGHFAAHRLEDSLAATRTLLRQSPESTPEVPTFWLERFPSMRVKRAENIRVQKLKVLEILKPKLFETLRQTYENLERQGQALVYDEEFFHQLRQIGHLPDNKVDILQVNKDETSSWLAALRAVVTLWDLDNVKNDTETIVYEAKRLSLRWLILATDTWTKNFNTVTTPQVVELIDQKAKEFTRRYMANVQLQKNLSEMALAGVAEARRQIRSDFEKKLTESAKKLKAFATLNVNLNALMNSKKFDIKDLIDNNPSPFVRAALEALGKAQGYQEGYNSYRRILFSMLSAYKIPRQDMKPDQPLTIKWIKDHSAAIQFNPELLKNSVPQKYLDTLRETPVQSSPLRFIVGNDSARAMDLKGMIQLGEILHFDKLEEIPAKGQVNPQTIKLSKGLLGFGSEMQAYFNEFKKDIINSAPILGASLDDPSFEPITRTSSLPSLKTVWEVLADGLLSEQQASDMIEIELKKVPGRVDSLMVSLQHSWEKVEQGDGDSLSNVNEEMRVLVTRATQLSFILSSFAGFNELNDEIRAEILAPGFWENEWNGFKDWSDGVFTYLIGFMVLQLVGAKTMAIGRITDQLGKALAPVFGPNFSRLNVALWGVMGIPVGSAMVKGFGTEVYRQSILQRYFECGAGGPCVALYSDVAQQNEIARASRMEVVGQFGFLGAILLGFWGARWAVSKFARTIPMPTLLQFKADLRTLGLTEKSEITKSALEMGEAEAIRRARSTIQDPVAQELAITYAKQATSRIEKAVWTEASRWISIDQRFADDFKKMGLGRREAKVQANVNAVYDDIAAQYKAGEITLSQFQERRGALLAYYQAMASTWAKMEKDPVMKAFYERVFDFSTGVKVQAQIRGELKFLDQQIRDKFMKEIESQYVKTATSFRYQSLLENMIKQTQANPSLARAQMENLRRLINRQGQ